MKLIGRVLNAIGFLYYFLVEFVSTFRQTHPLYNARKRWRRGQKSFLDFASDVAFFAARTRDYKLGNSYADGEEMFHDAMTWRSLIDDFYDSIPGNLRVELYDEFVSFSKSPSPEIRWIDIIEKSVDRESLMNLLSQYSKYHPKRKMFYSSHPVFFLTYVSRKIG